MVDVRSFKTKVGQFDDQKAHFTLCEGKGQDNILNNFYSLVYSIYLTINNNSIVYCQMFNF